MCKLGKCNTVYAWQVYDTNALTACSDFENVILVVYDRLIAVMCCKHACLNAVTIKIISIVPCTVELL